MDNREIYLQSVLFNAGFGSEFIRVDNNKFDPKNDDDSQLNYLGKFKKVNFFIGQNNSGKSRFLRNLFRDDNYAVALNCLNKEVFDQLYTETKALPFWSSNGNFEDFFEEIKKLLKENQWHFSREDTIRSYFGSLEQILLKARDQYSSSEYGPKKLIDTRINEIKEMIKLCEIVKKFNFNLVYIPVLRGLRRWPTDLVRMVEYREEIGTDINKPDRREVIIHDIYKWLTKNEYFNDKKENEKDKTIYTGYTFYKDLKNKLLGSATDRESVKKFESFLSQKFFNGQTITLTPRDTERPDDVEDKKVTISIGGDEHPIQDVGDGLQQLIIISFPIFSAEKRSIFFIEEPDLFMHPGMQKALINIMLENNRHQFFITTHSNHLIDTDPSISDVATFHFSKIDDDQYGKRERFIIKPCLDEGYSVLQDIGVKPSSILLANCTIWVEGHTDRLYIKAYLLKYIAELGDMTDELLKKEGFNKNEVLKFPSFKEDYHYSYIEYQGCGITHWAFGTDESEDNNHEIDKRIKAIKACTKPFLVADKDAESKYKVFPKIKDELGDCFYLTNGKEIENLVPEPILKSWLKTLPEKMNLNKALIDGINESDYSNLPYGLGRYLDKLFQIDKCFTEKTITDNETKNLAGSLSTDDKKSLCKHTYDYILNATSEDINLKNKFNFNLNALQKDLCKKLLHHIKSHNF